MTMSLVVLPAGTRRAAVALGPMMMLARRAFGMHVAARGRATAGSFLSAVRLRAGGGMQAMGPACVCAPASWSSSSGSPQLTSWRQYNTVSKERPELTRVGLLRSLRIKWQLYNIRQPWGFDPDEFVEGTKLVWEQVHEVVYEGDLQVLKRMKKSMTPAVYRELKDRAQESEATSHYKLPAQLEDAHIINVFGSISKSEVRLAMLVEFLVRYTPTEDEKDDLWDKPQWVFESPLLTFRDEGYATDPVEELSWTLAGLRPPTGGDGSKRKMGPSSFF